MGLAIYVNKSRTNTMWPPLSQQNAKSNIFVSLNYRQSLAVAPYDVRIQTKACISPPMSLKVTKYKVAPFVTTKAKINIFGSLCQ